MTTQNLAYPGMTDAMVFEDVAPLTVPVTIGKDEYVLKEASGDAACRWRNAQLRAARMVEGKITGVGDIADTEPLLVSLCLFTREGKPVPLATVRAWPNRVQKALFERAKAISHLNEDQQPQANGEPTTGATEEWAKNSPSATTAG